MQFFTCRPVKSISILYIQTNLGPQFANHFDGALTGERSGRCLWKCWHGGVVFLSADWLSVQVLLLVELGAVVGRLYNDD